MNTDPDDREIERLLLNEPLRRPSPRHDQRMADLFDAPPVPLFVPLLRAALGLASCAALVMLLWLVIYGNQPATSPRDTGGIVVHPPPKPGIALEVDALPFNPVRIEQVWSDVQPEGVILVDGDPLRRYHRQTFEHVQLIDDARNIRIEFTVPHRDVIVTPVRYD